MKFVPLLIAFSAAALAQDPAPEKPASEKPAAEKPAAEKPVDDKFTPAKVPENTTGKKTNLKPATDLPELPSRGEDADLTKGQPGGRIKPAPEKLPGGTAAKPKPKPGTYADRSKTRTALRAPLTAADLDLRIRYRQAESKAANDPVVQSAWEDSRAAKTDYGKREAMTRYYEALFKRMLAIDKGIAPVVEDRKGFSLRRLKQTRVDPTDPLDEEARWRRD
jgi:hypothetical protein